MADRERVFFNNGPRFFEEGGRLMFAYRSDAHTEYGPMPATEAHKEKHWAAFQRFSAEKAKTPELTDEFRAEQAKVWGGSPEVASELPKRGPGDVAEAPVKPVMPPMYPYTQNEPWPDDHPNEPPKRRRGRPKKADKTE